MARPVMKIDNKATKAFLSGYMSFLDLPGWCDDIIRGSKGQMTALKSQVGSTSILRVLQSVDEISTQTVGEAINKKRMALDGVGYSQRMVDYYTAAARCASQGIQHYLAMHGHEDPVQAATDATQPKVYFEGMQRDFTHQERETVRELSISGSFAQLKTYITSLN